MILETTLLTCASYLLIKLNNKDLHKFSDLISATMLKQNINRNSLFSLDKSRTIVMNMYYVLKSGI